MSKENVVDKRFPKFVGVRHVPIKKDYKTYTHFSAWFFIYILDYVEFM